MPGKTVLVVDDEPHIRYMLDFKLRQAGFAVLTACTGEHGYDVALRERPDLIVADYHMPGCDGLELCRMLRGNPLTAPIPVVILTARGYRLPATELAGTNVRELIDKPFSPRRLVARIAEMIEGCVTTQRNPAETGTR